MTNPNLALTSYFMCAETDEEARRRADGIPFFQFALRFYGLSPTRERPKPGEVNLWDEYEKWKRANPEGLARALSGGLIGSPETIRRKLRRFETSHIDQVIFLNQAGKNTHEHICESLELFAREVMPEFHAHESEQQAWKQQVLNREIELEEIDTAPYRDRYGPNSVQVTRAGGGVVSEGADPVPRSARYFFAASESAHDQFTSIFDFVSPTLAAAWNLRWQVRGFLEYQSDRLYRDA